MKVALVHDYLNEYGGAERVLETLAEMYPESPIYTAFFRNGSAAYERFKHKQIKVSWAHYLPGFASKLHSPLRFLAPQIWQSFNFSEFDVVISSSSWYITKGINVPNKTLHVSYIHTPPRYLYGYKTAAEWQKNPVIKVYAGWVNKGLRQFDYESAQRADVLVANSQEVQARIKKFWRRESVVIYPPVELPKCEEKKGSYFLTGGRLVGPKHFDVAIKAARQAGVVLKVFGTGPEEAKLKAMANGQVEFLGRVEEAELCKLYAGAKAFVALADDEDFGMTPVEAMGAGTPVVAYWGGGYKESVLEGETGMLVKELTPEAVAGAMRQIEAREWRPEVLRKRAERFSKERFIKEMGELVVGEYRKK